MPLRSAIPAVLILILCTAGVPAQIIGRTGGDVLKRGDGSAISVAELRRVNEAWLPGYMTDIVQAGEA